MNSITTDSIDVFRFIFPCSAMVFITYVVWVKLYIDRIGEMTHRKIKPTDFSDPKKDIKLLKVNASDNFKNIFEVPLLFYVLMILIILTHQNHDLWYFGAWIYVILRAIHSFIHCTYNIIVQRFYIYAASTVLLALLWVDFSRHIYLLLSERR
jgi:hypothetical protein